MPSKLNDYLRLDRAAYLICDCRANAMGHLCDKVGHLSRHMMVVHELSNKVVNIGGPIGGAKREMAFHAY